MGVNLKDLFQAEPTSMNGLKGSIIAVDSLNWMFQFLSTIRQRDGQLLMDSQGRVTSHLSGLFYRCSMLLKNDIKPIFVFDGEKPKFKERTMKERREKKEKYAEEYKEALDRGDVTKAFSLAARTAFVDEEILSSARKLLDTMGIPYITAPSEGEAQCSHMNSKGQVDYVASQDYDAVLFGANKIIRNLNTTGRRRLPFRKEYTIVHPEMIDVPWNFEMLGINRKQAILMSMLMGNDYTKGVHGLGPKKSLKIVKEEKDVIEKYNLDKEIIDCFVKPKVKDFQINFGEFNEEKLKEFLFSYEFSEDRIRKTLDDLKGKGAKKQASLDSFFGGKK